jgi:hypothetical protein
MWYDELFVTNKESDVQNLIGIITFINMVMGLVGTLIGHHLE